MASQRSTRRRRSGTCSECGDSIRAVEIGGERRWRHLDASKDGNHAAIPVRAARRLAGWGTTRRLTGFFDLAFKGAALLAAFSAAAFFQQPNVEFVPRKDDDFKLQTFVDVGALQDSYTEAGQELPFIVGETARRYNSHNQQELYTTQNVRQYSPVLLCDKIPETVVELFPQADCDATEPYLGGRGRSYEGLLLQLNLQADRDLRIGIEALQDSLLRLRDAEYLVVRYVVENSGSGYADNVQVLSPEQFRPSSLQPISLAPGRTYGLRFESDRGTIETTPTPEQLKTQVSWDKGAAVLQGWILIALWILFVLFVVSLAWALIAEIVGGVMNAQNAK